MLKVTIEERIKAAMQRYEKWWIKSYTGGLSNPLNEHFANRVGRYEGATACFEGGGQIDGHHDGRGP